MRPSATNVAFILRLPNREVAWRLPQNATEPWAFGWMQFIGGGTETVVDERLSRHGQVHPLPATHPMLRRLLQLADTDGPAAVTAADVAMIAQGLLVALAKDQPANSE